MVVTTVVLPLLHVTRTVALPLSTRGMPWLKLAVAGHAAHVEVGVRTVTLFFRKT